MNNSNPSLIRGFVAMTASFLLAVCVFAIMAIPGAAFAKSEAFVISADPHVRFQGDDFLIKNNADTLRAFKWARSQENLKAVVVAGDIADRGYASDFTAYDMLWQKAHVDAIRIQCMGNHDTNNGGKLSGLDIKRCATSFKLINNGKLTTYSQFNTANIMTIGGPYHTGGKGVYTSRMLEKLNERLLDTVRQGKMAIVVSHYPYSATMRNSDELLAILKSYPNVIYVSGHVHYYPSKRWFEVAKLKSGTTPYRRAGINTRKVSYPIRSLGTDSITCNHNVKGTWKSAGQSIANLLKISRSGKISYLRYSLKEKRVTNTWKAYQLKGSVTVKAVSKTSKKKGKISYKVVFSDGREHDGIASGTTIKVRTGKQKTIDDIPAGVLVTVKCVDAPAGWSKAGKGKLEVIPGKRAIIFKHSYKKPKKAKKATKVKPKKTAPAPSSSSAAAETQPATTSSAAATEPEQMTAEPTLPDEEPAETAPDDVVDSVGSASETAEVSEDDIGETPDEPILPDGQNEPGMPSESASSSSDDDDMQEEPSISVVDTGADNGDGSGADEPGTTEDMRDISAAEATDVLDSNISAPEDD